MDKTKQAKLLDLRKKKIDNKKRATEQQYDKFIEAVNALQLVTSNGQESTSETLSAILSKLETIDIESIKEATNSVKSAIKEIPIVDSVVVSNLADIPQTSYNIDLSEVTESIKKLTATVESKLNSSLTIDNRKVEDFLPVRRVREVNGRLVFDDSPLQVSVVGGGGGTSIVDTSKLATEITLAKLNKTQFIDDISIQKTINGDIITFVKTGKTNNDLYNTCTVTINNSTNTITKVWSLI